MYRYFLPLALDGDLCSPLCFPEAAVRLIWGLWQSSGAASPQQRQRIAQLFSKEIEYSEENREDSPDGTGLVRPPKPPEPGGVSHGKSRNDRPAGKCAGSGRSSGSSSTGGKR